MRERWEYTWSDLDLENGLVGDPRSPHRETINERGSRGWEMVSVICIPGQTPCRVIVFFKRPAAES
ncbi:MAG: hypothetical protein ACRDIY_00490 [Chloroflexota bacterium]